MLPNAQDTIVAIATPPGRGAIGVVRISGAEVRDIAERILGGLPAPRMVSLRRFTDAQGDEIDEGLVLYFRAPNSFTGEDLLELQSHGGTVVLSELTKAAVSFGARHARPGEFTERAFLNGKLDLVQAEAVADLIDSTSKRSARSAYNALQGHFSAEIDELARDIAAIRVRVEATIDFPEEAIDETDAARMQAQLAVLRDRIASIIAKAQRGVILNTGLDVAIVGRPNVGKSTLLNQLAQTDTAIVSGEPGTTRDVLSVDIQLQGLSLRVHDTAGIHDTGNSVEIEGIRRAMRALQRSDFVLLITEADQGDEELLELVDDNTSERVPIIAIRNKIDLFRLAPKIKQGPRGQEIYLSALTGAGLELLRQIIIDTIGMNDASDSDYIARQRHIAALDEAAKELAWGDDSSFVEQPDIVAERLRRAHGALGRITGEFTTEDLLGEIFSTFCLGK